MRKSVLKSLVLMRTRTALNGLRLSAMRVRNFRPFTEEVVLDDLEGLCLLVGPNNVGKSSLLMPLRRLTRMDDTYVPLKATKDGLGLLAGSHTARWHEGDLRNYEQPPDVRLTVCGSALTATIRELCAQYESGEPSVPTLKAPNSLDVVLGGRDFINISLADEHREFLEGFYQGMFPRQRKTLPAGLENMLAQRLVGTLAGQFVFIPPTRVSPESPRRPDLTRHEERRYDGSALLADLLDWYLPGPDGASARVAELDAFEDFVSDVLGQPTRIWPTAESVHVKIGTDTRLLTEVGAGVVQVAVIGAALARMENPFLLLEEPEQSIHPGLQRALLRGLQSRGIHALITTHSNHIVDSRVVKRIYQVRCRVDAPREVTGIGQDTLQVLADLGVSASSISVASSIIWVEGPSDAIYIRAWIAAYPRGESLEEGRDFTFAFHGGALLAHFRLDLTKVVSFLSTHPSFYLVADSDRRALDGELGHDYLREVLSEPALEKRAWVTLPKEIEGYLPDVALAPDQSAGETRIPYAPLSERLTELGLAKSLAERKVELATKAVKCLKEQPPEEVLAPFDLRDQIGRLVAFIEESRDKIPS